MFKKISCLVGVVGVCAFSVLSPKSPIKSYALEDEGFNVEYFDIDLNISFNTIFVFPFFDQYMRAFELTGTTFFHDFGTWYDLNSPLPMNEKPYKHGSISDGYLSVELFNQRYHYTNFGLDFEIKYDLLFSWFMPTLIIENGVFYLNMNKSNNFYLSVYFYDYDMSGLLTYSYDNYVKSTSTLDISYAVSDEGVLSTHSFKSYSEDFGLYQNWKNTLYVPRLDVFELVCNNRIKYNSFILSLRSSSNLNVSTDFDTGFDLGFGQGYNEGFNKGQAVGVSSGSALKEAVLSVPDAFLSLFKNMLNFEILGINFYGLATGVITLSLVIFVYKKVKS